MTASLASSSKIMGSLEAVSSLAAEVSTVSAFLWRGVCSALCPMTLYKLFENKVVLNASGSRYFLRGLWYFAQNRMLEVMAGSGEAQKSVF